MNNNIHIAAQDVRCGDEVYNSGAAPGFGWVRVIEVKTENDRTIIKTSVWETWKHRREGVMVRRQTVNEFVDSLPTVDQY